MGSRRAPPRPAARPPVELVVIGASAGGVSALLTLLSPLPAGFRLPIVALLHLLPRRESRLCSVLSHALTLPVREPVDKEAIQPGCVYVGSPDYHLLVELDRSFSYSGEPPVSFARPSIDVLMTSAADAYGPAAVGVLLTGANADGAEGMAAIRARGGITLVQDPADAEVPTMPEAAIARCRPDHILPLNDMPQMLLQLARTGGAR
ncbi:chemotaxis protein CheB [Roseateles puraquae]|jgi:two-component system chemotaxis response regulator CheB|uniref:protein-glutamate methylesterase n=1 Tax=Roseateles puraquae TaxID=431059 RepID=A0A254N3C6_9BURK|nr:chemotaxis protein CheB [Roseateles puraquae]MDG0855541.1 chemotaxis protein CheB [Roseateles puraquae]OWR02330.1 chemotaxis protein CheB [Roseateles puraquae]